MTARLVLEFYATQNACQTQSWKPQVIEFGNRIVPKDWCIYAHGKWRWWGPARKSCEPGPARCSFSFLMTYRCCPNLIKTHETACIESSLFCPVWEMKPKCLCSLGRQRQRRRRKRILRDIGKENGGKFWMVWDGSFMWETGICKSLGSGGWNQIFILYFVLDDFS